MNRVTEDEVKQIMGTTSLEDTDINMFITTANVVVSNIFADDVTISTALLREIELWYSAHLIACTRMRTASKETIGDATVEYSGKFGEGLSSTPYGQMVKQFDVTGKMAKMGKSAATIRAVKSFDE